MIKQATRLSIFVFLVFVCSAVSAFSDDLSRFLPVDGEMGTWRRQRAVQHYVGEDLYEYIDGGAEIYHEYGFKQVVVQDYVNAEGKSVSVEIFEMTSAESAYGMYTFKTNVQDSEIPLGNDGQLADYYLNFWKGPFLVTLTGFDETGETVKGLLDIAMGVESKLEVENRGQMPPIVSLLPREDLEARSLKYFRGLLGLRSSHPFFSLEIIGFEQGIKGDYADGYSLFLIRFGEEGECQKSYQRLKEEYEKMAGYEEYKNFGAFLAEDSRERRFFTSTVGKYLFFSIGEMDNTKAKRLFQAVKEKIIPPFKR